MRRLVALLAPMLLCLHGCCEDHVVVERRLASDGQFQPAAVSGLPAQATSVIVSGVILNLDGDGHPAADQRTAQLLEVYTNPAQRVAFEYFDLTPLAHDLVSLGTDLRPPENVAPVIGRSYTLSADGSGAAPGSGAAVVVAGIDSTESFALDIDVTIPTTLDAALHVAGVAGFTAQTNHVRVQNQDCR